jgi:hypothetical protein
MAGIAMVRTVKPIAAALLALTAILTFNSAAAAANNSTDTTSSPSPSPTAEADDGEDIYKLAGQEEVDESNQPGGNTTDTDSSTESVASTPAGKWVKSTACDTVGASGCLTEYSCEDGSAPVVWIYQLEAGGTQGSYSQCPEDPEPIATTPPIDIPGEALKEFKKVELPASTINVQPPNGETLVNFKTILSTRAERHQVTVRLNQVNIDLVLEVWPSHFLWKHGDETTQETSHAGLMWSEGADVDGDGFVTHVYTQALKAAQVSVDTTWSAQFKVVGAPDWRPVNGTVTKVGEPLELTVREATPELVTDPG